MTTYFPRLIDAALLKWKESAIHKPILLRGARQVGKSSAVRHLGETFEHYVELNLERDPVLCQAFKGNLDPKRIIAELSLLAGRQIIPGSTLLFLDEIQGCPEAVMALRYFKEEMPDLHVIAAGSLLEFTLQEIPTFGVGRIQIMYMYPMAFDEFLMASGESLLIEARDAASPEAPLSPAVHERCVSLFRTYLLVGGMPESVSVWLSAHDYLECQKVQDDILQTYEADFPKYNDKVTPRLLTQVLRSVAVQTGGKFNSSAVGGGYTTADAKKGLETLILAGLCIPVTRTAGNGLPLGAEEDPSNRKILLFDTGLLLRMLGGAHNVTTEILTDTPADLVNRGVVAEMAAGLELQRYHPQPGRMELYYWQRETRNSQAEIDYLVPYQWKACPIEVKAGTRGGMKSLWLFMRAKELSRGVRSSLENFGTFKYEDEEAGDAVRDILVCPLYALSRLDTLLANG